MGGSRPRYDWSPVKALFIRGHTARQLAALFEISDKVISNKAVKEKWGLERAKLKILPPGEPIPDPPIIKRPRGRPSTKVLPISETIDSENGPTGTVSTNDAFTRALRLKTSDSFRERVISQADKALQTLEKANLTTVHETDRFAEALTKVERIGARAYGYDREGDRPIINIGILGSGTEYDPV